ncbi:MAG: glycosyltransferase family 2 protein [Minisyncoccia bacterium]
MSVTISVCTIVKNEGKNIRDFITSFLPVADELLIADTGSTDNTVEIIKELMVSHKNIILYNYSSEGTFHFGRARNFLLDKATKDYVLMPDADERPSQDFIENIREFLVKEQPASVTIVRKDELVPHLIDVATIRIVSNDPKIRYGTGPASKVHEQIEYTGKVLHFNSVWWHNQRANHYLVRPQRMFLQMELQVDRLPKTKSFFGHFLRGVWYFFYRFKKIYFTRGLYRDGALGFKFAFMRALDAFLVELFVGLKPSSDVPYWERDKSK